MPINIERRYLEGGAFVDIVPSKGNQKNLTENLIRDLRRWAVFYAYPTVSLTEDEQAVIQEIITQKRQLGYQPGQNKFTEVMGGLGRVGLERGAVLEIYGVEHRESQLVYPTGDPVEYHLLKVYPRSLALVTYNLSAL